MRSAPSAQSPDWVWAVLTLGRWFTTVVRVADDQQVVGDGPDRWGRAYAAGRVTSIDVLLKDIERASRSRAHA